MDLGADGGECGLEGPIIFISIALVIVDCLPLFNMADLQIYTPKEFLEHGLKLVGFSKKRIKRAKPKRNNTRFKGFFGVKPYVAAKVWEDIQTTDIPEAKVNEDQLDRDHFLMALHHLKRYPTELEREPLFDIDPSEGRFWVWFYVGKIRGLKALKITWPSNGFGNDIWAVTVDGVDCWIAEPTHPVWSQDKDYYSHKYNKAGLRYELGISISDSRLVWMNGPFKAGASDKAIFNYHGLKDKLEENGKMAIADGGYSGHPDVLSTPNYHDSPGVKLFKSRALKRHEHFNGIIKTFDCLTGRFRHDSDRFQQCFEAICVLGQYTIESSQPLYDVLIDAVVNA